MAVVETHEPGAYTPRAGLYECDCTGGHLWRIDLAGHLFPPFPPGCSADRWRATEVGAISTAAPEGSPRP
ncbi:hypothetical protein J3A78_006619 [Streptomyces sp. PvR006]|nr:hypothetical protein [Streptomyces sp. PvR006]